MASKIYRAITLYRVMYQRKGCKEVLVVLPGAIDKTLDILSAKQWPIISIDSETAKFSCKCSAFIEKANYKRIGELDIHVKARRKTDDLTADYYLPLEDFLSIAEREE